MSLSEIQQRRTFAIISHPDAGKTTITERLTYVQESPTNTQHRIGWS